MNHAATDSREVFRSVHLNPGNYHGLEPNRWLIEEAFDKQIGRDIQRLKNPFFLHHDSFTVDEFGTKFEFILAQSIFSHSGPNLTRIALSSFCRVLTDTGIVVATFIHGDEDTPDGWKYPGCVRYRESLVYELLENQQLVGQKFNWFHPRQSWWILSKDKANIPKNCELALLNGVVLRDSELRDGTRDALRRLERMAKETRG